VLQRLEEVLDRLKVCEAVGDVANEVRSNATILLKASIRFHLSSKRCLKEKLTKEMFEEVKAILSSTH